MRRVPAHSPMGSCTSLNSLTIATPPDGSTSPEAGGSSGGGGGDLEPEHSPLLGEGGAAGSNGALPDGLFERVAWRIIPPLWIGYTLNIVDRVNLGYAQLQMSSDLHLSPKAFGYASGVFFLSYAVMQVPTNHLIPRVGATRILALSMLLWGISASATSMVGDERQLLVLRFALGLAESGYYPGVLFFLTRWFPDAVSGRALALFSTAASVGGLLAAAGSGGLMSALDGVGGVRGWRWLLGLEGLPTIALGLLVPRLLQEHPHDARSLSAADRDPSTAFH